MTAILFTLTDLDAGRFLGAALVCPEARYASIAWRGAARADRRFLLPKQWLAVENELLLGLESGPLETTSSIVEALLPPGQRCAVVITYLHSAPVDVAPAELATTLDQRLQNLGARTAPPATRTEDD